MTEREAAAKAVRVMQQEFFSRPGPSGGRAYLRRGDLSVSSSAPSGCPKEAGSRRSVVNGREFTIERRNGKKTGTRKAGEQAGGGRRMSSQAMKNICGNGSPPIQQVLKSDIVSIFRKQGYLARNCRWMSCRIASPSSSRRWPTVS